MTLGERDANIKANRAKLKAWLVKVGCDPRGTSQQVWFPMRTGRAYFVRFGPWRIGHREIRWDKWASVDLTQPEIFNERGKLKIRLLKSQAPAWVQKRWAKTGRR